MAEIMRDGDGYRLRLEAEVGSRRVSVDMWAASREEAIELQAGALALVERVIAEEDPR